MKIEKGCIKLFLMSLMISCTSVPGRNKDLCPKKTDPVRSILYYASLAASSHNTQPWKVTVVHNDTFLIFPDFSRKIGVVDPRSKELFILLGAFTENLNIAANYFGYLTKIQTDTKSESVDDSTFIRIVLQKQGRIKNLCISELEQRRTMRCTFLHEKIDQSVISQLISDDTFAIHYFSA